MTHDRYGDRTDSAPLPACGRPGCRGVTGYDDDYRPIPCLVCRPHLRRTVNDSNDYGEHSISDRAREAIERDNQGDSR